MMLMVLEPVRVCTPNSISIGSAIFAQLTAEGPYTLQWTAPSPSTLSMGGSGPLSNSWFLWPTWVHVPNGICIGSAVLVLDRDRQTDRPRYSVCNNRLHLRA